MKIQRHTNMINIITDEQQKDFDQEFDENFIEDIESSKNL